MYNNLLRQNDVGTKPEITTKVLGRTYKGSILGVSLYEERIKARMPESEKETNQMEKRILKNILESESAVFIDFDR